MSDRVVHFENGVDPTSDEQGIISASEPFNETVCVTENHVSNGEKERKRKTDRWRSVTRSIQSAICIHNSVQPTRGRRKPMWKSSSNDNIDPFIQKFSTRPDRKTTPPTRILNKNPHKITIENNLQTITDRKESDAFSDDSGYQGSSFSRLQLVFDPEGHFIYTWSYFVVFAIRYNLWVLILRIAFLEAQSEFKIMWMVFDYICDFIYLVDMLVSFRTGYLDEGILVTDSNKIALSYIKSNRFVLDILSFIPTDFIHVVYSVDLPLVRLNRILKSYKSLSIKNTMELHTDYPTFYRVFFLLHLMFLLINWNAGIYIMISRAEGFGTNQWVYPGNGSLYQQYFKSLYWSTLTLTAIGDLPSPATNYE